MKITLFTRKSFPGQFSIENVFSSLKEYLERGNQLCIYQLSYYSKGVIRRLLSGLKARQYQGDVNHIIGDINFIALFLKKRKTIITIHDCDFILRSKGFKRQILIWFWLKIPIYRSALVTTISLATKEDLDRLISFPSEKIHVIYNPLTLVSDIIIRKPVNNPLPVLLQIGTKLNKNLDNLILAIKGLNVILDIVGTLSEHQVQLLKDSKIKYTNSVNISQDELIKKYQSADLLTFVSLREGFGLPIVEANALGCPVLTSAVSSMPEVAGEAAHLVNPYDFQDIRSGVLKILSDKPYAKYLIEKGYRNVDRFKPVHIANQYISVYNTIIKQI